MSALKHRGAETTTVAHKRHYALFHNTFRIIKYAFQIMHNTFQILRNTSWIHYKFWNLRNTFQNLRNTFRNLHNTFAPGPQVLAEKKEAVTQLLLLSSMLCFVPSESLQVSFKFCPKCGKDLAANLAHGSCDVDSQKNIIETYFLAGFSASLKSSTIFTFRCQH